MVHRYLIMNPSDNVAVALVAFKPGDLLDLPTGPLTIQDPIPVGHKLALCAIPAGSYVIKYGEHIGRATADIAAGGHAHVQNVLDITEEVYETERRKLGL